MGQQRQCSRLIRRVGVPVGRAEVGEQQRDEPFVDFGPGEESGPHDGVLVPGLRRWPEHHVPLLQRLPQPGVADRLTVEVGAQREDDQRAARQLAQRADQAVPLSDVVAEGESRLELVDDGARRLPSLASGASGRAASSAASRAVSSVSSRTPVTDRSTTLAGRPASSSRGRSPARSSDDFPAPDGPMSSRGRSDAAVPSERSRSVTSSRPKNHGVSAAS